MPIRPPSGGNIIIRTSLTRYEWWSLVILAFMPLFFHSQLLSNFIGERVGDMDVTIYSVDRYSHVVNFDPQTFKYK